MKSNYSFYVELVSNDKFNKEVVEEIQNILESDAHYLNFVEILSTSIDHTFTNHIEIYVEDQPFETDVYEEIEKILKLIDSLIPGGWANDSKIEWISEAPKSATVWFKDNNEWKKVVNSNNRDFIEDSWDPFGDSRNIDEDSVDFYDNYGDY